jgi:hypothetical protein
MMNLHNEYSREDAQKPKQLDIKRKLRETWFT